MICACADILPFFIVKMPQGGKFTQNTISSVLYSYIILLIAAFVKQKVRNFLKKRRILQKKQKKIRS